jgi:hypothetical protein
MKFKIENVPMKSRRVIHGKTLELLEALQSLEVGQSFMAEIKSADRMVLSIAGFLLDRRFVTDQRRDDRGKRMRCRVGRTE